MSDDEEFDKAFEGFGEDEQPITPPEPPVKDDEIKEEPKDAKEDKPAGSESKDPAEPNKEVNATPPSDTPDDKSEVTGDEKPNEPEVAQPLTKDDVASIISNLRNEERTSSRELETTTSEVLEKYYPDGLSNVLVDEQSGKELRTPQDVVDASGGQMSTEEAAQWLMNEQFKLDKQVDKIKNDAKAIAETTVNFKRDAVLAVEKYEPLFKAYPKLQEKVYEKLMKQVKVDQDKGVILSAPDVMEFYGDWLEPYQQAYEFGKQEPATNPPATPAPAKPTADDRMDVAGDGGPAPVNDPNNFAQQVTKELAKGF